MDLKAAVGDLRRILETEITAGSKAVTLAVKQEAEALKQALRSQALAAGLGRGVSNAWRSETYPKGRESLGAAGLVWTKAPDIVTGFDRGSLIRTREAGGYLAIPLPAAPKRVLGKRVTPASVERSMGIRLRMVYRRGKPSLLVADLRASRGQRGGFRAPTAAALRTGRGLTTVPMFLLLPQVKLKKKLDVKALADKALRNLPRRVTAAWEQVSGRTAA
jgi:hypothetical protein